MTNRAVQKQIQQDWVERETLETIQLNILKVTQFLNDFDASMRFKLSQINERLVALERTIENCELSSGYLSNEVINRGVAKGTSFLSQASSCTPMTDDVLDTVDNRKEANNKIRGGDKNVHEANAVVDHTETNKSLDEAMGRGGGQSLEKLQSEEKEGGSSAGGEVMDILDDKQNMSKSNRSSHTTPEKNEGIGREMESSPITSVGSAGKKRPPRPGAPPPRPGGHSMPENAPPLPTRPINS